MARWTWRAGWGVRVFGAACLALAAVAYVVFQEPLDASLALALATLGLFALLVLAERVVPAPAAGAMLRGGGTAFDEAARGLGLEGRATTAPPGGNLTRDRLFLSAEDATKPMPVLEDSSVIYAGPATVRAGLAVDPPGRSLADAWEAATGQAFGATPVAALEPHLAGLGLTNGVYRELRIRESNGRYEIGFTPTDVRPPCFDAFPGTRLPCERTACALCSTACVGLARTLARPLSVVEAEVRDGRVRLLTEPEAE